MAWAEPAAGGVVLLGLAALFGAWRGRARGGTDRGADRLGVFVGWALTGCGVLGWGQGASPDVGLSRAVILTMTAALALIAGRGLLTARAATHVRPQRKPKEEDGRVSLGAGSWRRAGFRLFGALVAAPAGAVGVGLAWRVRGPGADADRLIGMVLAAVLAMALALVVLLASRRPGRVVAAMLLVGLLAAGGALAPQSATVLS